MEDTEDPEEFPFCTGCGERRTPVPPAPQPEALLRSSTATTDGETSFQGTGARLVGTEGAMQGREFVLDRAEISIGRQPDCDIFVQDPSVSRLHAWIRRLPVGFVLEDSGGRNGTEINGVRLHGMTPVLLKHRDVIRVGGTVFTFHGEEQPQSTVTRVMSQYEMPQPFSEPGPPFTAERHLEPPRLPTPARPPEPPRSPTPDRPPEAPSSTPPPERPPETRSTPIPGPGMASIRAARTELAELARDVDSFIQRLNALAETLSALQAQLAEVEPPAAAGGISPLLEQISAELEAEGGEERFRDLQGLVAELRASPANVELLLRLSRELPAVDRLLEAHLRVVSQVRQLSEKP